MIIDTHAHLNFAAYKKDIDQIIDLIVAQDMKVINVGSQHSTSERAVALADKHQEHLFAAIGLHPIHLFEIEFTDMQEMPFRTRKEEFDMEAYRRLAQHKNVVAIGEIGLDYFRKPTQVSKQEFESKQKLAFLKQLQLARGLNLPVILHCRGDNRDMARAYRNMLTILKEFGYYHCVIHCFAADWDIAKRFLDLGCMISFTGIITFPKTAELEQVVKKAPMDKIMAETDSPYLAPQLVRGQRNEPRFVTHVIGRIAEIKGLAYDEAETALADNAKQFFSLK